jgi:hypothetical protein
MHPSHISKTEKKARALGECIRKYTSYGIASAKTKALIYEELPDWIKYDANAWQMCITQDPSAVLLVDPVFWGTVEQPTKQGIAVANALYAQQSVFVNCLPYLVQENFSRIYGVPHPSQAPARSHECPPAPKRARYELI